MRCIRKMSSLESICYVSCLSFIVALLFLFDFLQISTSDAILCAVNNNGICILYERNLNGAKILEKKQQQQQQTHKAKQSLVVKRRG